MGGCDTDAVPRVLGIAMDRFQCTWVAMIGEMHELIAEYLGNGSGGNLLSYIGNAPANGVPSNAIRAPHP